MLRPSSSTSGGQSERGGGGGGACVVGEEEEEVWVFIIAAQDATEVQERQLGKFKSVRLASMKTPWWDLRFAIFAQDDAFWKPLRLVSA